jgi:hypothetical protein
MHGRRLSLRRKRLRCPRLARHPKLDMAHGQVHETSDHRAHHSSGPRLEPHPVERRTPGPTGRAREASPRRFSVMRTQVSHRYQGLGGRRFRRSHPGKRDYGHQSGTPEWYSRAKALASNHSGNCKSPAIARLLRTRPRGLEPLTFGSVADNDGTLRYSRTPPR